MYILIRVDDKFLVNTLKVLLAKKKYTKLLSKLHFIFVSQISELADIVETLCVS